MRAVIPVSRQSSSSGRLDSPRDQAGENGRGRRCIHGTPNRPRRGVGVKRDGHNVNTHSEDRRTHATRFLHHVTEMICPNGAPCRGRRRTHDVAGINIYRLMGQFDAGVLTARLHPCGQSSFAPPPMRAKHRMTSRKSLRFPSRPDNCIKN